LQNLARMKLGAAGSVGRMVLLGSLASLLGGCVTLEGPRYGVPVDAANRPQGTVAPPQLLVSAKEVTATSTPYLGLVEVTFENHTSVWKQVDRVAVDFGSPAKNQSVTIASGDDIAAWVRAVRPGGWVPFGGWVGQPPAAAATAGAAGTAAVGPVGPGGSSVPTPPIYPDQHLLTMPIRIPPGLSTNRWILLSTRDNPPGGCIDSMILGYETADHEIARLLLRFKADWSSWQELACYPDVPVSRPDTRY
jgi:hypothetical protein